MDMRTVAGVLWVTFWLGVWSATPAWGQTTGQIRATVVDADQNTIVGVSLSLFGESLVQGAMHTITDPNGSALFIELPPGDYRLEAQHAGLQHVIVAGIRVNISRTSPVTVQLEPHYQSEPVIVHSRIRAVDTEATSRGQVLTKEFMEQIPSGRSYQTAVTMSAGVPSGSGNASIAVSSRDGWMAAVFAPDTEPAAQAGLDRSVHHHGAATLRASRPAEVLELIADRAVEAGGRVDHMNGQSAQIRVPVAHFDEVWTFVLGLGDVVRQRVQADDVTDAFQAGELRVRSLERTLDRLVALLARASTEAERLSLLDEIARVSESLDVARIQHGAVSDLAAMSRIGIQVVPFDARRTTVGSPPQGMAWLTTLSPFDRTVPRDARRVPLPVPDGLVALTRRGPFHAESADGTALWTWDVENNPTGDGRFWLRALRVRVAAEFDSPQVRHLGDWSCLAVDEPDSGRPYHWMVCMVAKGPRLRVASVFYPSPEHRNRHGAAIDDVLKGGAP